MPQKILFIILNQYFVKKKKKFKKIFYWEKKPYQSSENGNIRTAHFLFHLLSSKKKNLPAAGSFSFLKMHNMISIFSQIYLVEAFLSV